MLAVVFVPDVADALRSSPPRARLLASLAFVVIVATVAQAVGYAIGSTVRAGLGRSAGSGLHRTTGSRAPRSVSPACCS